MALEQQDLKEIRTLVTDIVTKVVRSEITRNNESIAAMFEDQNGYIDQRFAKERSHTKQLIDERFTEERAHTKQLIDERFVEERVTIRSIVRIELDDIRRHVEKLEQLEIADIQEALDEIASLKKRLTTVEGLVAKLQLTSAR